MSERESSLHDVCAIVVSHNGREWLDRALGSLVEHAGEVSLDVVVVDNGSDGAAEHAERAAAVVRGMHCENRGFGHANNRGLETARARYILFINPDTEVLEGSLAELVAWMDARPEIGLAGARQVTGSGALAPSIRRFPSLANAIAEAVGVERLPGARRRWGERELDPGRYAVETSCDWTAGSFMLARREALEAVGSFDERFFLFAEETDLCWRLKEGGWQVVHTPAMTIRHYEQEHWHDPRLEAQSAYARLQFAEKNLGPLSARAYRGALALRYGLRAAVAARPGEVTFGPGWHGERRSRREAKRRAATAALRVTMGGEPPFPA